MNQTEAGQAEATRPRSVTLPRAVEAVIVTHARADAPLECCGLLIGDASHIVEARRMRNVSPHPEQRYAIDPQEHFQAIRDARTRSWDVIGVYHSHPHSPAVPSPTDEAEGFGEFVFLIVGLAAEPPDLGAWQWFDGNFSRIPLVRVV